MAGAAEVPFGLYGHGWAKGSKRMWGPDPEAAILGHHHGRPQDFFTGGANLGIIASNFPVTYG